MNKDKLTHFIAVYSEELRKAVTEHPEMYYWPITELPQVIERMTNAINKGTANINSLAFKMTCKKLGIKHTYKAINEYLES